MGSAFRNPSFGGSSSGMLPTGVKLLLIGNTAIFLLQFILYHFAGIPLNFLKLIPAQTVSGYIWQPVSYMFLHDVHGATHILWNMISLFFTGPMLEMHWGTPRFLKYYFLCGIGAGLCVIIASFLVGASGTATLGASGALFGILVAYGVLTKAHAELWITLAAAVVGLGYAIAELLRSKVTPAIEQPDGSYLITQKPETQFTIEIGNPDE
jgi:membrane associated rhomboid family serine protease